MENKTHTFVTPYFESNEMCCPLFSTSDHLLANCTASSFNLTLQQDQHQDLAEQHFLEGRAIGTNIEFSFMISDILNSCTICITFLKVTHLSPGQKHD